ncbi:pseudouridine synthase [Agaribacterium haliotis]|uniref:pseudouridine synthase n=1 Tax=Agaribacterium haliotis TaxID=2013869 RepID=UPI000BB5835F|nr:pseudouridine synthase [Agaribacterium haliotis]
MLELASLVVDETEHFWLLDKPVDVAVNDDADHAGLISQFKGGFGLTQAHPVHRLDKATSGLLLVAKHAEANAALSQAFQQRAVDKRYLAVVRAKPGQKIKKKSGLIKGDMKPSRSGSWKLCSSHENPAITRFVSFALGERRRLCWLKPSTGKTHQLRVAMKALAAPIVGDQRYGSEPASRLHLHSAYLAFTLFGQHYAYYRWPASGEFFHCAEALEHNNKDVLLKSL